MSDKVERRFETDIHIYVKVKVTVNQAWTGPEGSRRLRFQISRQSAHEGGKVVSPTHRSPLPPRKYS